MVQPAVVVLHHQLVFKFRAVHLYIRNALVQLPQQIFIAGICNVVERHRCKSADYPLPFPNLRERVHQRIDLSHRERTLQDRRTLILPHPGIFDAVSLQVLQKFLFSDISAHHAVSDILHRVKILIGKRAVPSHRYCAKGIAVGNVRIFIDLRPLSGILGASHQIHLFVRQHLQGLVPAFAGHILHRPVYIITKVVEIFYIHPGKAAVRQRLVIAVHREKTHTHRALISPLYRPRQKK